MTDNLGDLTIPANRSDAQKQANACRAAAAYLASARDNLGKLLPDPYYTTRLTEMVRELEFDATTIENALDQTRSDRA